jgi:hypothetical protein
MKIKTILGVIGAAILVWHLVVWMSITKEFNEAIEAQCAAGQSCTDTINVNPVTDNVTITISSPLKTPSTQEFGADFASGFMVGFKLVVEPLTERKLNKASRNYFDVYAMILPYNATLELGEHNETQASDAENVTRPSVPAVTVSTPNRVLELSASNSVCGVDYLNAPVSDGEDTVSLRAGKYEKHEQFGESSVKVKFLSCLDRGVAEHALLATDWVSCGGSCNSHEIVQVFGLRGAHPVLVQQIYFDSDATGTGATFDDRLQTLTITGRSNEESPHCCPRSLDVITYRWEGQEFVQRGYRRMRLPPS